MLLWQFAVPPMIKVASVKKSKHGRYYIICDICHLQESEDVFQSDKKHIDPVSKIMTLQSAIRGWHYRRKCAKMKASCVIIQAAWRGYSQRKKYWVSCAELCRAELDIQCYNVSLQNNWPSASFKNKMDSVSYHTVSFRVALMMGMR